MEDHDLPAADLHERALIAEFRQNPLGDHSPNLRRLLLRLRSAPAEGKYVLVTVEPQRRWMLGQLQGRGRSVQLFPDIVFDDLAAAEWEVFRRRWRETHNQR